MPVAIVGDTFHAPGAVNYDFTTGTLPGSITFTRSSTATYNNVSSVLSTATTNTPRFNYISATPYLLIEPAATNLLPNSDAFTSTGWSSSGNPVRTAAQFTSPDGTNNGWSISSGGSGFGSINGAFTASTGAYTISVWTKNITGSAPLALQIAGTKSSNITISATVARYNYTVTPGSGATTGFIYVNGSSGTVNGVFGAQVEAGSVMTSYIPNTTSGTASRSADVATFTIPGNIGHLTYTFDDSSTQLVSVSAGSYTIPTNLNRPNIKTIVGSA